MTVVGNRGRELRPKMQKIILYFKNLNLCTIDKWGTCEIVEFIDELISRSGFFNEELEWTSVAGLVICCSISDSTVLNLSDRYLSRIMKIHTENPDNHELRRIISNQLSTGLSKWQSNDFRNKLKQIVEALVNIFSDVSISLRFCSEFRRINFRSFQVKKMFAENELPQYNFSPKLLSRIVDGLEFYTEQDFSAVN